MGRLLLLITIMYGMIIFGQTAAEAVASVHDGTMESRAAIQTMATPTYE